MSDKVRIYNAADTGRNLFVRIEPASSPPAGPEDPITPPVISLTATSELRTEGNETLVEIPFSLAAPHVVEVLVTVDLYPETPGAGILDPDFDFDWSGPLTYSIPIGETDGVVAFAVVNDQTSEPDESHRFVLSAAEEFAQEGFAIQTLETGASIFTLTVTASDPPAGQVVDWQDAASITVEEGETVQAVVTRNGIVGEESCDISVTGSALSRINVQSSVTFAAGSSTATVDITGVENNQGDVDDFFTLGFTNLSAGLSAGTTNPTKQVTVTDAVRPQPVWGWFVTELQMGEPGNAAGQPSVRLVEVELKNAADNPVRSGPTVFGRSLAGSTAIGNTDYTFPNTLTINEQVNSASFQVEILPDAEVEQTETIVAALRIDSGIGSIDPAAEVLEIDVFDEDSIQNGDDLLWDFAYPGWTVDENGSRNVEVRVKLNRPTPVQCQIVWDWYSPNMVEGVHYASNPPSRIILQPGQDTGTATFVLEDAATDDTLRWVVAQMRFPTHGNVNNVDHFIVSCAGATDVNRVPPEPPLEEQYDDFRIYGDRWEMLTFDPVTGLQSETVAYTGSSAVGFYESPWNDGDFEFYVFQKWQQKNPDGVRWMDKGREVVIRIMEDVGHDIRLGGDVGASHSWNRISPSQTGSRNRIRDLRIIGEDQGGGVRPRIGLAGFGTSGGVASVNEPDGVDNVSFEFLDIVHRDQQLNGPNANRCISSNGGGVRAPGSEYTCGLIRFNNCRIYDDLVPIGSGASFIGSPDDLHQFGCRIQIRANWWFTDNQWGSSTEHGMYLDQAQGVMVIARNTQLDPAGRTILQVTSRAQGSGTSAGAGGGPMSHGFAVIDSNTDQNIGYWARPDSIGASGANGTQAIKVQGHFGRLYITNNTHTGTMWTTENVVNRGGVTVICEGQISEGCHVFEYPYGSGQRWNALYVEFDGDLMRITEPTHRIFNARTYTFNGVYELVVGEFDYDIAGTYAHGAIEFNSQSWIRRPGVNRRVVNQIGEDINVPAGSFLLNRAGGVSFTGPPGPTNGSLLSYAGIVESVPGYAHFTGPRGTGTEVPFRGAGSPEPDVDTYDGTDPS